MGLGLNIFVCYFITTGVCSVHQIQWLPCQFTDEHVSLNAKGHLETQLIYRQAMVQFGQKGDTPVNPHAITFLITGSKLDLRRYLDGVEGEQLECEIRRYNTEGIHIHWPSQEAKEYNRWFTCTLRHDKGLFTVTGFLRHPSSQGPPGQQDYRSWPAIADTEILTTSVAMVTKTQTPSVKATLGSQQRLDCQFAVDHRGSNTTLEWHLQGPGRWKKLLSHTSRTKQTLGSGARMKAPAGGDASYTLRSTEMNSEGTYICSVLVYPLVGKQDVILHIEEPPRVSLNVEPIFSLLNGTEHKVVCEAKNYYPLDVEIRWYEEDPSVSGQRVGGLLPKMLQNILLSSHRHNQDMTYTLSSFFYLRASIESSGKQFTCSVSHKSMKMPIKKSFILKVEEPWGWMFYLMIFFIFLVIVYSVKRSYNWLCRACLGQMGLR